MTIDLFPRLDPLAVAQSLEQLDTLISEASRPLAVGRLPATTRYSASGGSQLDLSVLTDFRAQIIAVAIGCGFPERGTTADRARFDLLTTSLLADFDPFESGEADRDDVWAFLATILLPDVVQWRFSGRSADRFHGGIRNTFQRLWMRAWALDCGPETGEGRWLYVQELTEDALVQLTERPSIGADPRLCQAIARAWVETSKRIGRSSMEDLMRRAIVDLRIRNEVRMTSTLSDDQLQASVAEAFDNAAALVVVDATSDAASSAGGKPTRTRMQSLKALFSKREVSTRTAF